MSPDVVTCTKTTSLAIVCCPSLSTDLDTVVVSALALCQIVKSIMWKARVLPLEEKPMETSDRRRDPVRSTLRGLWDTHPMSRTIVRVYMGVEETLPKGPCLLLYIPVKTLKGICSLSFRHIFRHIFIEGILAPAFFWVKECYSLQLKTWYTDGEAACGHS